MGVALRVEAGLLDADVQLRLQQVCGGGDLREGGVRRLLPHTVLERERRGGLGGALWRGVGEDGGRGEEAARGWRGGQEDGTLRLVLDLQHSVNKNKNADTLEQSLYINKSTHEPTPIIS